MFFNQEYFFKITVAINVPINKIKTITTSRIDKGESVRRQLTMSPM